MKSFALFFTAQLIPLFILAQGNTIAVLEFDQKTKIDAETKVQFENAFSRAASDQLRFTLLERAQLELIQEERERQKGEAFIGENIAVQGKSIGANYLVFGEILDWKMSDTKLNASGNYPAIRYSYLMLTLKIDIVSTESSEIIYTHQHEFIEKEEHGTSSAEYAQTWLERKQELMNNLVHRVQNYSSGILYLAIPPVIKVLELSEASGKKAKSVVVGTTAAFREGLVLEVYLEEAMVVDGENLNRKIPIGQLIVDRMEGEKIALCKVKDGGKEIKSAFDAGESVLCAVNGWRIKYLFLELESYDLKG